MTQIYDYAIIGGGLSGLALATALTQKSQNVLILESNDALGGANRFFADHRTTLGIRTVPNTPEARAALHFLGDLLGVEVAEIASGTRPYFLLQPWIDLELC
jgi:phytoene dehydrogenase-like protein